MNILTTAAGHFYYGVRIVTGSQEAAGGISNASIQITLVGSETISDGDTLGSFRGTGTPLSYRAMTSYERHPATRALASCKLELTVLELVVTPIYHAAHINQQKGSTLASREDRTLRTILQRSLISGCDLRTRSGLMRGSDIYLSVVAVCR